MARDEDNVTFALKAVLMIRQLLAVFCIIAAVSPAALAEPGPANTKSPSMKALTPIFGQRLLLSFPAGFKPAFEDTKQNLYIQESVLVGETVQKWTQMLTVTGAKGLASNPNVTPQGLASNLAGGYKNACPSSFSSTGLGSFKAGAHEAFAAVVSCGTSTQAGASRSESMLVIVIKGESDFYTIQWAERGAAVPTPIPIDDAKWKDRFQRLIPIKLCPLTGACEA